jgi:nitrogenase iron protein
MREKIVQIALYGKGGIGKSTIAANVSAALAAVGHSVLQIGCDPKHDSTRLLLHGSSPPTVLDYIRDVAPGDYQVADVVRIGAFGVRCVEAGGPEPGVGCAGRGILTTFELLDQLGVLQQEWDVILYDVLGDVVCGGFAVPIRSEYADRIFIVTSGEFMSIYAANNILRGLKNYQTDSGRVGGLIFNTRGGDSEHQRVLRFAKAVCLPVVASLPRDEGFASSERAARCLVEHAPNSASAETLRQLALAMSGNCRLYSAQPLTDEALEQCVLQEGGVSPTNNSLDRQASDSMKPGVAPDKPSHSTMPDYKPHITAPVNISPGTTDDNAPASAQPLPQLPSQPSLKPTSQLISKSVAAREPLHGCAFNGAITITTQLKDCVSVAHGPLSCAHIAYQTITSLARRFLLERGTVLPMLTAPPIISTDMNESVMVFGGGGILRERVLQAMANHPPAVFVISTCPSGIIGEDLAACCELGNERTRVIPIAADGNLAGDHLQGIFLAYQQIARELVDRQVVFQPDLVNIIGEKTIANATEGNLDFVTEVISRLGLQVNCRFICETDFEQVRGLMRAPLNLLATDDYMGRGLRDFLQAEFGARFFEQALPIGFAESCNWVTKLATFYNREDIVPDIIDTFRRRYNTAVEQLRPVLRGRKLMVVTFNHNIDWLLSTALDIGMNIAYVGILSYSQDNYFRSDFIDQIGKLQTGLDFSALERTAEVRDIEPDVLIGNYLSADDLSGVVLDTIPLCPDAGFLSGITRAKRWAEMMRIDIQEGWRNDAALYHKHLS